MSACVTCSGPCFVGLKHSEAAPNSLPSIIKKHIHTHATSATARSLLLIFRRVLVLAREGSMRPYQNMWLLKAIPEERGER